MKRKKKIAAELRVEREIRETRELNKELAKYKVPFIRSYNNGYADGAAFALKELRGK